MASADSAHDNAGRLLDWYDRHRRRLPWRSPPGSRSDPYVVWLSEIMLQQTTVVTVGPYFEEFLSRWPTVEALAAAELDAVLHCWQGLGYYARARNLHKCAGVIVRDHQGRFPESESELLALPGVGPYTAAAIAAIAFDRPAVVVDGNVERVMARYFRIETPLPDAKAELKQHAADLSPDFRPGDYAQAVMDLGATICTPRKPNCLLCPWAAGCRGRDIAESLPARRAKKDKPTRRGIAFWLVRPDGAVLMRRRPPDGLLGGLMEFPSTPWLDADMPDPNAALAAVPLEGTAWFLMDGMVRHGFTHFHLELRVLHGRVSDGVAAPRDCLWCSLDGLANQALPTLMKKVADHAIGRN